MAVLFERTRKFKIEEATESKAIQEAREIEDDIREESEGVVETDLRYKTKKSKGEIVEDWWVVKVTEKFDI